MLVDDIAKATGYSSGTTFYLVKTLVDLRLACVLRLETEPVRVSKSRLLRRLKLRASGHSTNLAIHRYFWERSPVWQKIHFEELQANENIDTGAINTAGNNKEDDDFREEELIEDARAAVLEAKGLKFDTIDARFLSSASLVRARVNKLLQASPNHLHVYTNLLIAIVSVCC
jgi:hypothetical protein